MILKVNRDAPAKPVVKDDRYVYMHNIGEKYGTKRMVLLQHTLHVIGIVFVSFPPPCVCVCVCVFVCCVCCVCCVCVCVVCVCVCVCTY